MGSIDQRESEAEWARSLADGRGGHSGFQLLIHGIEAHARRALLAERACHSLDVQTYIFEDGHSTRRLLRQLIQAAQRGVKVRLLLDDLSVGHQQYRLAKLDSHPNIEVRLFNPIPSGRRFTLTRLASLVLNVRRLHRRMHNKLWLADRSLAIFGGRNLGDDYFSSDSRHLFIDIDALAVGGETPERLGQSFDAYWSHSLAVPLWKFARARDGQAWRALDDELERICAEPSRTGKEYDEALDELRRDDRDELAGRLEWAAARVLWDDPEVAAMRGLPPRELRMSGKVVEELDRVEHSLEVVSGYLIPHDLDGIDLFALLARGVKVVAITNALEATDVPLVHGGYAPWRKPLLAAGAKLYEIRYQPLTRSRMRARLRARTRLKLSRPRSNSLHAKTFAFDHDRLMIASFNLDPRSVWWNCELGVVIESVELNRELRGINAFGALPEHSYAVHIDQGRLTWISDDGNGRLRRYHSERGNPWRRFQAWVARVLRLERLL